MSQLKPRSYITSRHSILIKDKMWPVIHTHQIIQSRCNSHAAAHWSQHIVTSQSIHNLKKNTAITQLRQVTAQSLFPIIPIQPAATLRHSSQCGVPPNLVAIDHWHNLFPRYTLQRHTKIKVQTLTLPGRHDEVWNQQQLSKGIQTNHWNTYSIIPNLTICCCSGHGSTYLILHSNENSLVPRHCDT